MRAAGKKHKSILHPIDYGSDFCNYIGFFSIVMLAIVNCDYKFLFFNVGCRGRISDAGVFRNSAFNKASERDKLNLPDPAPLPTSTDPTWLHEQNDPLPYVFVADDAFSLGKHFMKPYPQINLIYMKRVFNYKISRKRRISENEFGIWGSQFRVITTAMAFSLEKAVTITLATDALHTMLRTKGRLLYTDENLLDKGNKDGSVTEGDWRSIGANFLVIIPKNKNNHAQKLAEKIKDTFDDHFYGAGAIP